MEGHDRYGLFIVGIVGIVAIVALVLMEMSKTNPYSNNQASSGNLGGNAAYTGGDGSDAYYWLVSQCMSQCLRSGGNCGGECANSGCYEYCGSLVWLSG
jgi:hypothetical protein